MLFVRTRHVHWHRRTQLRTMVSVTQGTAATSPRPIPVGVLDNPGMRASVQHISSAPRPATHRRERDGTPRPQQRLHDQGPGLNAGQPYTKLFPSQATNAYHWTWPKKTRVAVGLWCARNVRRPAQDHTESTQSRTQASTHAPFRFARCVCQSFRVMMSSVHSAAQA